MAGLADVVEDGGQAQHQVGAGDGSVGPGLQVDGLVQDGQGVLVDVLVSLVLVDGLAQGAQLGQDDVGHPGVDHELQSAPGPGADEQALELGAHALGGDDLQAGGHLLHGGHDVHLDVEAELGGEACGPHDAQGVVVEGLLGADGGAQDAGVQVGQAAAGVDELEVGQAQRHGVDGEVAAGEVPGEGVAVGDLGLARADLVGLGAVGGDLHDGGALRAPMVPKARPTSQVVSPQAARIFSVCSGRAEVVRSRSWGATPRKASRTGPPTSAISCPARTKAWPRAARAGGRPSSA